MSHEQLEDGPEAGWDEFDRPADGQEFRHYKGGEYRIIATGVLEADLSPMINYQSLSDGTKWFRPAADFFATVDVDGQQQPRFKAIEE